MVGCSYQCGARLSRRLMIEHQRDLCPQRPMDVKLECFMRLMEAKLMTERERHERELAKQKKDMENKMAELKVTITSSPHYVVTTPLSMSISAD